MIRTSVKKGEKVNEMEELITYVEIPVEEVVETENVEATVEAEVNESTTDEASTQVAE